MLGLTKTQIPLRGVGFGASVRVYLVDMEELIYPLLLFWGWKKAQVYGSQVTTHVQGKAVGKSTKQLGSQ